MTLRFNATKAVLLVAITFLQSCGGKEVRELSEQEIKAAEKKYAFRPIIIERKGIKIIEVHDFPKFVNAKLSLNAEKLRFQPGDNTVQFDVDGFRLGEQTKGLENLKLHQLNLGQTINILSSIKSNQKRVENGSLEISLREGKNKFVAFLNRSFNVPVKQPAARVIFEVNIDENGSSLATLPNDSVFHIVTPADGQKIRVNTPFLFDAFVNGVEIAKESNYIGLFIDGLEFRLYKNAPFLIEGLLAGEHTLVAKIFSADGKALEGIGYYSSTVNINIRNSFEY